MSTAQRDDVHGELIDAAVHQQPVQLKRNSVLNKLKAIHTRLGQSLDVNILTHCYASLGLIIKELDSLLQPVIKPLEWTKSGEGVDTQYEAQSILGTFEIRSGLIQLRDGNFYVKWEQPCVGLRTYEAKEIAQKYHDDIIRSTLECDKLN